MRQVRLHRLLHQIFAAIAPDALGDRQAGSKLHQPVVEQRFARLQTHRHAHPVRLGQDVAGQPDVNVRILRPVQRVTRRRLRHRADIAILRPIGAKAAAHVLAE